MYLLFFKICTANDRKRYADSSSIVFDINAHSGKELHQFKLCGIQLILSVLGNDNLVDKVFACVCIRLLSHGVVSERFIPNYFKKLPTC